MNIKIVTDSGADILGLEGVSFASAPLTIVTDAKQYLDDASLDVEEMAEELKNYKGRSSTACPGIGDWLTAFGDAEYVIALTITGTLSGSYNAACLAKRDYEEAHPERKAFVIDTLSAGPEIKLIVEKIAESIKEGKTFEEICEAATIYQQKTKLLFMLESMANLANNGRVSPVVAKAAGLLGIRVVGQASARGDLEMLDKCRGQKRALSAIVGRMKEFGYRGGKVRIAHCSNEEAALKLKELIEAEYQDVEIECYKTRGLCSFYAEQGGMLIGYEC